MLLCVFVVLCLSFVANGRKFHKHERYHLYKKNHISGAHRSLVFDIPDHVNKGKKGCKHGGILRKHGEVWSPGPCIPECHCINGEVTCSKLECPDLNCERTIKRKWKCCPECPPITERNGDKCGVRTIGGNANTSCCNFPFKYNGVLYYTCTYQNHNKPWCAVTSNFDRDGVWGSCVDEGKTKKKFHPVNGKFQDDVTSHTTSSLATGTTNLIPKILPSLTVNSVTQDHHPMPPLDPGLLKQWADTPQNKGGTILPYSAIRQRVSSIWKKIGFKKRVYNMLSKAGGQTVTVALANGGFLPKAQQSYIIPSQYLGPRPIIPKVANVVNVANNAFAMSQAIVTSYTAVIVPTRSTQVTMVSSQIVTGGNVQGSSGQILPSKVTVPKVALTTKVISGQVTTPKPATTSQGTGSPVTTSQPTIFGHGNGTQGTTAKPTTAAQANESQVTSPKPVTIGQVTGSPVTISQPTIFGQGNGTQGTTAKPTTAPQANESQVTTPNPTGNGKTLSDAVLSNVQPPLPNDWKSSFKGSSSPSDKSANVTLLQTLQKQGQLDASAKVVAQQQPWSPYGRISYREPMNSTTQHGGMNVSIPTQNFTPMPQYWNNVTAPQMLNNGSFGFPNIIPTTMPPPFVWPNITAPTQSTKTTASTFVWPNATAPTKPPVVWPNMTAPPVNTTMIPPVSGQNASAINWPVFTLSPQIPVNTTMAPRVQGNAILPETGASGAAVNNQTAAAPPTAVNTSQLVQPVNSSSNQAAKSYSSSNSYSSSDLNSSSKSYTSSDPISSSSSYSNSNTYSSSNSYSSSDPNSSSKTYSSSDPNNSSNTYSSSDPNSSSNTYSSSDPNSSPSTYSSSDPNSSSNSYSSSDPNSSSSTYNSYNPYISSSSYSDPYQQQQDQSTSEKTKQSEDSSKTKENEEKKEDDQSAHLYEYMTMQPPGEPVVPADPYEAQRRIAQEARELADAYNTYLKNFYASHGYGG